MGPQPAGEDRKPRVMWVVVVIFAFNAVLSFAREAWLTGALFVVGALAFWKQDWVDSRPRWLRYLIIAVVAALAVFSVVRTVQRVRGRW